jgi:Eukaryotic aspartyl protease
MEFHPRSVPSYVVSQNKILTSANQILHEETGESIPPSLIFGGVDKARIDAESTVTVAMSSDRLRPLQVNITGISYPNSGSPSLLSPNNPITAVVDSLIAFMWLPLEVCQAFEKHFGLKWDIDSELYLINDSDYQSLIARNINLTMNVGSTNLSHVSTEIRFPLASLILNASAPLVSLPSRVFAIKRAANSTQYTLGRAFLQQAYITADYDHSVFNISRAVFTGDSRVFALSGSIGVPGGTHTDAKALSGGAIAGIVVAALFLVGAGFFVLAWRMRWWPYTRKVVQHTDANKPELEGEGKPRIEVDAIDQGKAEADGSQIKGELEGPEPPPVELPGVVPRYELPATQTC